MATDPDQRFDESAPYTILVPTVYGTMLLNRYDRSQTSALLHTGRALDHTEIDLLVQIANILYHRENMTLTFLDVGANFGTYTMGMTKALGSRIRVHAFEPQRILFNMLAGSVALNSRENIFCHNVALGDHIGKIEIPQFDYYLPMNFGSVEFGEKQKEPLDQQRRFDPKRAEFVPLVTLDSVVEERVHMMKIDVEGMENFVLDGAARMMRESRPLLLIEFLKVDAAALHKRISDWNYLIYTMGINYLCLPAELSQVLKIEIANR